MNQTLAYQLSGAALLALIVFNPATVSSRPTITSQTAQVDKAKLQQALNREFYDLVIKGKFRISDLQASVKGLTYTEEFAENLIKIGGKQAYQQMLDLNKRSVTEDIEDINQAQQQLREFIHKNPEFMLSLSPEVRQQVFPILTINIPNQMKVWRQEQHQQNEMWKCSAVRTAAVCY